MMEHYHYTECGLDNVYLANGYEMKETPSGRLVSIHNIHDLHHAIGKALVFKPGVLIGSEIRFIRHSLDFSQNRLGELLGVTYQTILSWEKNKKSIPKTSDRWLRSLFLAFLEGDESNGIYEKMKTIAELDAKICEQQHKYTLEESSNDAWRLAA